MESFDLEREHRLVALLEHALDHPEEERREALQAICDDESLVGEALQLLAEEDEDFLARPAIEEIAPRDVPGSTTDVRVLVKASRVLE